MTLRNLINIRILILTLIVLSISASLVIIQAKYSIKEEISSSVGLTIQLIQWGISESEGVLQNEKFRKITSLKETRHLNIQLKLANGEIIQLTADTLENENRLAPDWFIWLVSGQQYKKTVEILTDDKQPLLILIKANPLDEINEVWQETRAFFAIILLLSIAVFLAINLAFNNVFKMVNIILNSLNAIANGAYGQKLPHFSIDEFKQIAEAINHLTHSLDKTQQEKKVLTHHSLQIQEEERKNLSQELHDELGQSLTAIKVMAVTSKNKGECVETHSSIINICDHLFFVVRSMMKNLHPMVLTELGLEAALQELIRHWQARKLPLDIQLNCTLKGFDDNEIAIQVFRVIQEAITNTVKHSEASGMCIDLIQSGDMQYLLVKVSDNGQGCEAEMLKSGFGLKGMQSRVQSMDGTVDIMSEPNRGLKIDITIPLYDK